MQMKATKSGALYSDGVYYVSFLRSFVSLSRIEILTVFSEFAMYVFTYVLVRVNLPRLTLFRLALELIGTYPPR